VYEILEDLGLLEEVDLFKVEIPYPLNVDCIEAINAGYDQILVVEETYPVIETQLMNRAARGRISKDVPDYGELTPEVIEKVLKTFLNVAGGTEEDVKEVKGVRPSLCPGCPHRAAFYAISTTCPKGSCPAISEATTWEGMSAAATPATAWGPASARGLDCTTPMRPTEPAGPRLL
jgi:indolepyruvate ferredoxin oxidoreductase alpha subunit